MTKLFFITLLVAAAHTVCSGQDTLKEQEFIIYNESAIHYDDIGRGPFSYRIVDGRYFVFEFTSLNLAEQGNHSVAPSKVAFQMTNLADTFRIENTQIIEYSGIYAQVCKCQDRGIHPLDRGVIHGSRLDDARWVVTIDVEFYGRFTGKRYHIRQRGIYQKAER